MDVFSVVEDKFRRTPVRVIDFDDTNGVLRLRGRKTKLHLSSETWVHPEQEDENGWFDLRVRAADGRELLLHHSLMLSSEIHHQEDETEAHSAAIFPNVVIDNINGLSPERRVQRIQFRLKGMHHFFHYQLAEALRGYQITSDQVETLRAMRYSPERESNIFAPSQVYVVHEFPAFVNFRVEDRAYQVWSGGSFSGGNWDRIAARTYPVGEIAFDEPVTIETALDRIWEWRRFFTQMGMAHIPFEAISVSGSLDERAPSANLYLPNLKRRPKLAKGRYALSPRNLAFNFWADREQLGEAMRVWLGLDSERRGFRARLDQVIERMNTRTDTRDLVDLGSAVDSLNELSPVSVLPAGLLDSMVNAAHFASEQANAGIGRNRISGLLGSLQRPSLAMRFSNLGGFVTPALNRDEASLLARSATTIRNASAHGGAVSEQIQPRVSPTIEALTALCARFDLESCGIPSHSSANARTTTKIRFDEGMEQLRSLDADTDASEASARTQ
jgi:hypothetical protein